MHGWEGRRHWWAVSQIFALSEKLYLLFQALLWIPSRVFDISAWISCFPWHEPVFLCSSAVSHSDFLTWLLCHCSAAFLFFVLPVSKPNPFYSLWDPKCKLGFHKCTPQPWSGVWNMSIKVASLASQQRPLSADNLFLATISKGLEKEHENGANREHFVLASSGLWLKDFLTWNLSLIILARYIQGRKLLCEYPMVMSSLG